jgi:hypothetical protein
MDVQKDFADLCSLLNANRVEYLVVGGDYASAPSADVASRHGRQQRAEHSINGLRILKDLRDVRIQQPGDRSRAYTAGKAV